MGVAESFYANVTLTDVLLASAYYPILVDLAKHKHCLTYGESESGGASTVIRTGTPGTVVLEVMGSAGDVLARSMPFATICRLEEALARVGVAAATTWRATCGPAGDVAASRSRENPAAWNAFGGRSVPRHSGRRESEDH